MTKAKKPADCQRTASTQLAGNLRPLRKRKTKHFTELADNDVNNCTISKETYLELEKLIAEGMPLDPSLRFLGFEEGELDEKWVRFQAMFGPQVRDLKRLAAGAELEDLRRIRAGEKGWQSLGWYLERLKTERYGQRQRTGKTAAQGSPIAAILAGAKGRK